MWGIKIVLGLQIGQIYELKDGKNTVGRHESCDIQISHSGISRKHFEILFRNNEFILKDLNSINGTFVNSVLIKQPTLLAAEDKISCNDIIFEFNKIDHLKSLPKEPKIPHISRVSETFPSANETSLGSIHGNLAIQDQSQALMLTTEDKLEHINENVTANNSPFKSLQNYFENVVMPGVYQLAQWAEFRWVLGGFVLAYIILITLLSVFPLMQISRERNLKRKST